MVRRARQRCLRVPEDARKASLLETTADAWLEWKRWQTPATCRHTADEIDISARSSVGG
jgi:hypothetical protein